MIAEIICAGPVASAFGSAVSTDAQIFARELALLGIDLRFQTTAGSQKSGLAQAMAQALRRSDIIITLGGVGLSPDDCTREVICQGLQIPLEMHSESYQRIRTYCEAAGLPMPPTAQQACMMPRGGAVFPGEAGGAPGCAVTAGDQCIAMLPGGPAELAPMFMNYVYPFLAQFSGAIVVSRVARVFGVEEHAAFDKLSDLQNSRNPSMTLYPQRGEVLVRVTARANNKAQAANMCTPFLKEIVTRLGDCVYGIDVDSLEAAVVTHLAQKSLLLGVAEACTGGLLTQKLNLVPGAQSVFKFGVTAHANRVKVQALKVPEKVIKKYGAVSDRVAAFMACGAMEAGDANIGVGITGVAGDGSSDALPSGNVFIAVCTKDNVMIKRLQLPPETDITDIRDAAVNNALNMVRLILDYDPDPVPGMIPLSMALKGKIELCDSVRARQPIKTEDPYGAMEDEPGRRSGGAMRVVLITTLCVLLVAALGFIGYMLWDRYGGGEGLFSGKSSSSEETSEETSSEEEEPPPEEESGSDEEAVDADAPLGPGFGGNEDSAPTSEAEPLSPEDGADTASAVPALAPAQDTSLKADASGTVSATKSIANLATPPSSSSLSSSLPSSSVPAPPASVPASASEKAETSSSVAAASSSRRNPLPITPGGSVNLRSGKTSSETGTVEEMPDASFSLSESSASSESSRSSKSSSDEAGRVTWLDEEESSKSSSKSSDDEYFGWGSSGSDESDSSREYERNDTITVKANGKKLTAPIQEIVERVVQVEIGESFAEEALKAQAVAAYTYIQFHLARGQTPDILLSSPGGVNPKVSRAVASVIGQEIQYNGKPINATYFASCAGVTNNSEDIWTDALPYLRSVDSGEDVKSKEYRISRSEMRDLIEEEYSINADDYDEYDWITIENYYDNGEYVKTVGFCGEETESGSWVRAAFSLPSHAFGVDYDGDDFIFTVRGNGHGVGMSQLGAQRMAKDGYGYEEILMHYYSGVTIR